MTASYQNKSQGRRFDAPVIYMGLSSYSAASSSTSGLFQYTQISLVE